MMMMQGGHVYYKKGFWSVEEDRVLMDYVKKHGIGKWNRIAKVTGLKRSGKSCRLRWMNYLCPDVKRGDFSEEEQDLIIRLHNLLGNRWSLIAGRIPGRTDNQVKNYWNTHLSKKLGVKKERSKVYGSPKTLHLNQPTDDCNTMSKCIGNQDSIGEGQNLVLQQITSCDDDLNLATMCQGIITDDFGTDLCFVNNNGLNLYTSYFTECFGEEYFLDF